VLQAVSSQRIQAVRVSNPGKKAEMDQAPDHRVRSRVVNRQAAQQDRRQQAHWVTVLVRERVLRLDCQGREVSPVAPAEMDLLAISEVVKANLLAAV